MPTSAPALGILFLPLIFAQGALFSRKAARNRFASVHRQWTSTAHRNGMAPAVLTRGKGGRQRLFTINWQGLHCDASCGTDILCLTTCVTAKACNEACQERRDPADCRQMCQKHADTFFAELAKARARQLYSKAAAVTNNTRQPLTRPSRKASHSTRLRGIGQGHSRSLVLRRGGRGRAEGVGRQRLTPPDTSDYYQPERHPHECECPVCPCQHLHEGHEQDLVHHEGPHHHHHHDAVHHQEPTGVMDICSMVFDAADINVDGFMDANEFEHMRQELCTKFVDTGADGAECPSPEEAASYLSGHDPEGDGLNHEQICAMFDEEPVLQHLSAGLAHRMDICGIDERDALHMCYEKGTHWWEELPLVGGLSVDTAVERLRVLDQECKLHQWLPPDAAMEPAAAWMYLANQGLAWSDGDGDGVLTLDEFCFGFMGHLVSECIFYEHPPELSMPPECQHCAFLHHDALTTCEAVTDGGMLPSCIDAVKKTTSVDECQLAVEEGFDKSVGDFAACLYDQSPNLTAVREESINATCLRYQPSAPTTSRASCMSSAASSKWTEPSTARDTSTHHHHHDHDHPSHYGPQHHPPLVTTHEPPSPPPAAHSQPPPPPPPPTVPPTTPLPSITQKPAPPAVEQEPTEPPTEPPTRHPPPRPTKEPAEPVTTPEPITEAATEPPTETEAVSEPPSPSEPPREEEQQTPPAPAEAVSEPPSPPPAPSLSPPVDTNAPPPPPPSLPPVPSPSGGGDDTFVTDEQEVDGTSLAPE
ncbi:unnamed protein product [Vitrella brassicaformis CCMP3155]|uniref:EF-hand domain-containing protein n=1 Tax=Vitrella brassicaformis (strain CCMP3155) TaxID=1169540 RepID=A0A0G4EEU2_VITBC|nr:unnamed protein product [Vitrella brassicaformis CCMP3155]|eukprot:CEL93925.1 unnamed protein product [Vitrella brassicaformis CCMP3155]